MISRFQRLVFVLVNLGLGALPSATFLVWLERNCSLPVMAIEWGWPWISLESWPMAALIVWNLLLFALFGALHSGLAQTRAHRIIESFAPPQATRTLYMAATGLSLVALMGLWQHTGTILWFAPLPQNTNYLLSVILFWGWMALVARLLVRFDPLQFIGLKQLYQSRAELSRTEGRPQLIQTGIYAHLRHPVYAITLLAVIMSPVMSLDRALIALAMSIYLAWGIPVEERKLISLFGSRYETYRKQVPALFPRIRGSMIQAKARES